MGRARILGLSFAVGAVGCLTGSPEEEVKSQCTQPADCEGSDTACKTRQCNAGQCVLDFKPDNFVIPNQTAGDCQRQVCDGQGNIKALPDGADILDDGNDCTADTCAAGAPRNQNLPARTPCGAGRVCNSIGVCVECIDPGDCASGICNAGVCAAAGCGDGQVDTGEACDDGDLEPSDGCSPGCILETGWACEGSPSVCTPDATCGDNVAGGPEACDGTDLRLQTCITQGFPSGGVLACDANCNGFDTTGCTGNPTCGDKVAAGAEICDGTDLNGQTCVTIGFDSGELACNATCTGFDTTRCADNATCGNNVAEGDERCDGTDLNGETCETLGFDPGELACNTTCAEFDTSLCSVVATCGDNVAEGDEECDGTDINGETCESLGFDSGDLACYPDDCYYDTEGCSTICGNNRTGPGEVCDGTALNGKSCVNLGNGFTSGTLACSAECDCFDTSGCTTCGNYIVEGSEVCDKTELNGEDCVSQGFPLRGTLACTATCDDYVTTGCIKDNHEDVSGRCLSPIQSAAPGTVICTGLSATTTEEHLRVRYSTPDGNTLDSTVLVYGGYIWAAMPLVLESAVALYTGGIGVDIFQDDGAIAHLDWTVEPLVPLGGDSPGQTTLDLLAAANVKLNSLDVIHQDQTAVYYIDQMAALFESARTAPVKLGTLGEADLVIGPNDLAYLDAYFQNMRSTTPGGLVPEWACFNNYSDAMICFGTAAMAIGAVTTAPALFLGAAIFTLGSIPMRIIEVEATASAMGLPSPMKQMWEDRKARWSTYWNKIRNMTQAAGSLGRELCYAGVAECEGSSQCRNCDGKCECYPPMYSFGFCCYDGVLHSDVPHTENGNAICFGDPEQIGYGDDTPACPSN